MWHASGTRTTKDPSKVQQAFRRGLTALTQWVERKARTPLDLDALVEHWTLLRDE
ncbi:hypothetical protein [Streptomyces marianii]|uniref:hypothetical protein n=1 Tax=Streptomyces marianii TaxID=1817406 RepID=UPI00148627D8|nr:hypothetical protein [Streptomyces marianii]